MAGVEASSRDAGGPGLLGVLRLVVPLLFLNALLTCANLPSTPAVVLTARLSLELAIGLGLLAWWCARGRGLTAGVRLLVTAGLVLATILRYVHITVPGVMGRELDAYDDLPHLRSVLGVFREGMPLLLFVAVLLLVLVLVLALAVLDWLALRSLERALLETRSRRAALGVVAAALVLFVLTAATGSTSALFARPVSSIALTYAGQLRQGDVPLPPRLDLEASRGVRLDGAHVVLIFLESYGVTLLEDDQHYPYIAPRYRRFEERLHEEGLTVMSTKIESPAFGGGSWRAHATLMSGVRISNQHVYEELLASDRRSLVHLLQAAGYRTVAAEPGIQRDWPEADYFDFDRIYDAAGLDYHGKAIGWWKIPDQFTLYQIARRELEPATQPVFAKISLIMSHIPYFPIPPYVEDWSRFDDGSAYARSIPSVAVDDYRDLRQLSSRYVRAFMYELDVLEDFLVDYLPPNSLVIVSGDHQPPTLATHTNDSWAVPIHLISRREELVLPFARFGFVPGLVPDLPAGESSLAMEDFLPAFVSVFELGPGSEGTATTAAVRAGAAP